MFSAHGWTALEAVRRGIFSTLTFWDKTLSTSASYEDVLNTDIFIARWDELALEANRISWDILEKLEKAAVLSSSGAIVALDIRCIGNDFGSDQIRNYYTHLEFGTLGTGALESRSMEEPTSREYADRMFGPFTYCPIMLEQTPLLLLMTEVENRIMADNGATAELYISDKQILNGILLAHEEKKGLTRAEYKRLLAPNMKHEAFRIIWRQATKMAPELSRPGPRTL